jgi:ABC-type Zn uptake system ZnuABC Zn-binding protein ZnuA
VRLAKGIAKRLSVIDPANAAAYENGANSFVATLSAKMAEWEKALAPGRGTKVVVYHESWVYFLDWAGLTQVGALEPKPGVPPKPDHVAGLIQKTRGQGVKYLIQESFYPTQLSRIFAEQSGAQLRVLPTMVGAGGTQTYFDVIDTLVRELTR